VSNERLIEQLRYYRRFISKEGEAMETPDVTLAELLEGAANALEESHYAELEHNHLGCSVAKTGIYAEKST